MISTFVISILLMVIGAYAHARSFAHERASVGFKDTAIMLVGVFGLYEFGFGLILFLINLSLTR